ncbi:quinone oxidoreductase [Paecilomyces variotii No. 5]|uniref:Quinone oxidoreductase n=1 Tax=Byssochlamys spectabilis (strain No. 5 / NBRC 109023) TaxID=1356009 RepID=V5G7V7_BYSSN|nr:quinone oxidoreductase [Paecilomyces variotii No. 5]
MKAVGIKGGKGSADDLFIEDNIPDPAIYGDRILVKVHSFGLNRMDIMQREDRYPYALLPESGKILGVEFSGLVEAKGPECQSDFQVGQKCFGLAYGGAYAQKIAVSEKMLMHLPDGISFEQAAGFPETFFTATQAIHLIGGLEAGQSVLIHAGSSGVGQAAIQIARCNGASKIFTTAGSDAKCNLCKSLGADFAINYRNAEDFSDVICRETDGKGVNLIIDLVGSSYWHRTIASAAMDSRIVIVALMSGGVVENFSLRELMNKRIWVMTTTLRTRPADYQKRLHDLVIEKALLYFAKGEIKVTVDEVFPWSEVGRAHKKMESNVHAGKLICTVEE